jgi:hypothetical protein
MEWIPVIALTALVVALILVVREAATSFPRRPPGR